MLLHKNHKFIYNNRAALELPNNTYLDPNPDPCPIEGMVLYSEDLRTKIQVNFLETDQDARSFLEETAEHFESFRCIKPTTTVCTNGLEGVVMTFTLSQDIYEEYVFTLPGDEPALLNVWLEQKKTEPANTAQYAKICAELIAGISAI